MGRDPYRYFRIEGQELLAALKADLVGIEGAADTTERVKRLLRTAHTLKGAARVVGLATTADRAHVLEDLLGPFREGGRPPTDVVTRSLGLVDGVENDLAALDAPRAAAPKVQQARPGPPQAAIASVRVPLQELRDVGVRLAGVAAALQAGLAQLPPEAAARMQGLQSELASATQALERIRLVPVDTIFPDLERAVRDAASASGKQASFQAQGSLRLDASVLVAVREALLHAVRNAVAHGIQAAGTVRVTAERVGARVRFDCDDDGRGLDLGLLRRKAVAAGRVAPNAAFTHDVAARVLLAGGLSSRETADMVSGRGVGMDTIRDRVAGVDGQVSLSTSPRGGLRVRLEVPTSSASLEALEVRVAGESVLLPLKTVVEAVAAEPVKGPAGPGLSHRGQVVPLVSLGTALGRRADTPRVAVVVQNADECLAVGVDALRGVRRCTMHPLPALAHASPAVLGISAELGPRPALVVDALALDRGAAPAAVPAPQRLLPVLVIDDSLTTRMLEKSILETAGLEVDLAVSAEDALEKAEQRQYGLFVVDVEMPGMNGFEFIERTRAHPDFSQIPAILVSSLAAPEHLARGRQVGASAYITKGEFDQTALLDHIRRLVRRAG